MATATAAVFSPRTRETLRRGAVLGLAGALRAGDVVAGAARGVAHGVRGGGQAAPEASGNGSASSPAQRATAQTGARGRRAPAASPRSSGSTSP